MTDLIAATTLPAPSNAQKIAQSILPYNRDDSRARYLSYRASGFSVREALHLTGCASSTVSAWRKDAQFKDLEDHIQDYAHQLRREFTSLEFYRNFRLVLELDSRILSRELSGDGLSKDEYNYLIKIRGSYTPQQLQIIEALLQGETDGGSEFNWQEAILTFRKTTERSITVRKQDALPKMQEDDDKS